MVVWLQNFWGGLSSSKYTILNHFWLGQLKPPRLTQCEVYELVGHAGVEGAVLHIDAPVRFVRTDVPGHLGQLISPTLQELLSLAVIASFTTFADKQAVRGAGGDHWLGLKVWVGGCQTNQLLHHNGVSLTILTPYKLESQDYFAHKTHQARLPKDLVSLFSLVPYLRGNTGWRWLEVWLFHCQWRTWRTEQGLGHPVTIPLHPNSPSRGSNEDNFLCLTEPGVDHQVVNDSLEDVLPMEHSVLGSNTGICSTRVKITTTIGHIHW